MAMHIDPCPLKIISDHHKTQEMCEKVVEKYPLLMEYVSDHLRMQEICNKAAVRAHPYLLENVPDHFKT